ncbi:Na(+)-translocating NADH-quinone reductase subunit C [Gilvimarinus sp. F26214L]|uniref:Na(+)-translocating NADH-quinone reductase subunit C n=1 Tax=Gilvimarinus sp. DZF01 TaxID=3461371 RepID=UPI0040459CDC
MSSNDTIKKTFTVATILCLVCAVVVSTAAVMLKPYQEQNRRADIQRNILSIAGMLEEDRSVQEQFEAVNTRVVDLESGTYTDAVDPTEYDELTASRDPEMSTPLTDDEDIASINRQEKYARVYEVPGSGGEPTTIILPIRGYGLWGTLFGFIALEAENYEVIGLGFYQHQETPGLGGEVDNPRWKEQWEGKRVYEQEPGQVDIQLVKGEVEPDNPNAQYQVQGLSGATLTTRGVQNMLNFWMGEQGYAKFLRNLKAGDA